ncbi:MAG: hypothetical protein A2Z01_11620 [Betaproteobacteria bacterium RBG_16_58_11]|nr:MAG: hypothetical protein A2Z01_11620 [Betaproteobacteria bacterium RBG_16_58_11]
MTEMDYASNIMRLLWITHQGHKLWEHFFGLLGKVDLPKNFSLPSAMDFGLLMGFGGSTISV